MKQHLWHPFTQMRDWEANEQLTIERGKGIYLYDTNGNKYIDGVSSLWVNVHGHRKKEIDEAIKKQLSKIAHSTLLGLGNVPALQLAEKLVEIAPKGLTKVFYSDSGSTAVEVALKIAFQYWGGRSKTKFITLKNAYHGDTLGSVSVGGIDLFHKIYKPLLFKSIKVPPGDVEALEAALKKHQHEVAAMIVEPLIQAAAGMLVMPKGYLVAVRRLCTKYNVLLICDEVATGFGRTGKMFACEHENVSPDLMCVAKGLTGGYLPLAATLTTEKIYRAFRQTTFFHGHTYTGNPLGCAAALASLKLFKQEQTLANVRANSRLATRRLATFKKLKHVRNIRQLGLMVGIEIACSSRQVILQARKLGAILRPLGDVIVLMPPLCIKQAELERLLSLAYAAIEKATAA